jgi:hypothetical protein
MFNLVFYFFPPFMFSFELTLGPLSSQWMLHCLMSCYTYLGFLRLQQRQKASAETSVTSETPEMIIMVRRSSAGSIVKCIGSGILLLLLLLPMDFREFQFFNFFFFSFNTLTIYRFCIGKLHPFWHRRCESMQLTHRNIPLN